jgi:L-ascorbate metabolism protein UlaG (beta-lactamase superfamily)
MQIQLTHIDTACVLLDLNGYKIVTDPVFDQAGGDYHNPPLWLRKTGSPALLPRDLGPVDLVLLSHDQHSDNLDTAGRAFLRTVPRVISTPNARQRLGQVNVSGIRAWESIALPNEKVPGLRVTATPCQHGSDAELSQLAGPVIGFILQWEGQTQGVLYLSGDTVLFEGLRDVARKYNVHTAILHLGDAGFTEPLGEAAHFTFTAREALEAARLLGARRVIPIHTDGWAHFREPAGSALPQLEALGDVLLKLPPGQPVNIQV